MNCKVITVDRILELTADIYFKRECDRNGNDKKRAALYTATQLRNLANDILHKAGQREEIIWKHLFDLEKLLCLPKS